MLRLVRSCTHVTLRVARGLGARCAVRSNWNDPENRQSSNGPPIWVVVLTGGPCGGKSTAMSYLSRNVREHGINAFVVPEVATIMINGGTSFHSISAEHRLALQTTMARTQMSLEDSFVQVARAASNANGKPSVVLCDRGMLDGSAYMTPHELSTMLDEEGWKLVDLRDKRYDAVFHLVTAARGAEKFYSLENNAARSEPIEVARILDDRVLRAWLGHPKLHVFDNSTGFTEKIQSVQNTLNGIIGLPSTASRERKFLVTSAARHTEWPVPFEDLDVTIDFLMPVLEGAANQIRLTKRGQQGASSYIYSNAIPASKTDGIVSVMERRLSAREYMALKAHADPSRCTISQKARCFLWDNSFFTLKKFISPMTGTLLLEARGSPNKPLSLPPFLQIDREVTGQVSHDSYYISLVTPPTV